MNSSRLCVFEKPLPYAEAVSLQQELVKARLTDRIPDTFLLLQHPPVFTLGRRGRTHFLLANEQELEKRGVEVHTSTRGGDVTYHGPGQWVLYPILKLGRNEMGAHGYLHALEELAIKTADHFGITSFRKEGMAGGWCEEGKFAAIGFKFTRWVTSHGLSLNVQPDLAYFDLIVGCGLIGEKVTSFEKVLGREDCPTMEKVAVKIAENVETVFKRHLKRVPVPELSSHKIT